MRFSVYLGAFAAAAAAASTPEVATNALEPLTPAPIDFFAQTGVETGIEAMTYAQPIEGTTKGKNKKGLTAKQ